MRERPANYPSGKASPPPPIQRRGYVQWSVLRDSKSVEQSSIPSEDEKPGQGAHSRLFGPAVARILLQICGGNIKRVSPGDRFLRALHVLIRMLSCCETRRSNSPLISLAYTQKQPAEIADRS